MSICFATMPDKAKRSKIVQSCYYQQNYDGENFISDYFFSYQLSGTLFVTDARGESQFRAGDFYISRKNQLARFGKQPGENGKFKSVSILLDAKILQEISREYGFMVEQKTDWRPVTKLHANALYRSFIESILPYVQLAQDENIDLVDLKIKEAVLLLLQVNPELKNVLFDFAEPGKIDLEAFMQQNYQFNVGLPKFAYLTGRSLATFKRDFEKLFHTSPGRWIMQKRLEVAYRLIASKGLKSSDVYLQLGFEDLSHFSFAFKKQFGIAPSHLQS